MYNKSVLARVEPLSCKNGVDNLGGPPKGHGHLRGGDGGLANLEALQNWHMHCQIVVHFLICLNMGGQLPTLPTWQYTPD